MAKKTRWFARRIDRGARSRQPGLRSLVYWWLESEQNPNKWPLDLALLGLITASLAILVIQTAIEPRVDPRLDLANVIVLLVFVAEYLSRFLVGTDFLADWRDRGPVRAVFNKVGWMLRPTCIIDLLAIIPSTNALRALRVLRFLRVVRILRLLKLGAVFKYARYASSFAGYKEELKRRRDEFSAKVLASAAVVLFSSIAVFCIEKPAGNESIATFIDALWWSVVTCTTVGYGDTYPITTSGRVVATLLMLTGITAVGGAGAIVTSVIMSRIDDVKAGRMLNVTPRSHVLFCGWTPCAAKAAQILDDQGFLHDTILVVLTDGDRPREENCRYYQGSTTSRTDLSAVAVQEARHAVVFNDPPSDIDSEQSDGVATMIALQIASMNPDCNLATELLDDGSIGFMSAHLPRAEIIRKEGLDAEVILNTIRNVGHTSEILCDLSDFNVNRITAVRLSDWGDGTAAPTSVRDIKRRFARSGRRCVFLGYLSEDTRQPVVNPANDQRLSPATVIYYVESVDEPA